MLVISLSTIPSRFDHLGPTLETLLAQTAEVAEVRLNIPTSYRRFPDYDGSLPKVPAGIRIVRPEEDMGPATKILPAALDLRGRNCQILFCDDDRYYPKDWAESLLRTKTERPHDAIAYVAEDIGALTQQPVTPSRFPRATYAGKDWAYRRARLQQQWKARTLLSVRNKPPRRLNRNSGYRDTLFGFGGVLVEPDFFDDAAFDIPPNVWSVDDIWLSGCLERRGIGIWAMGRTYQPALTSAHANDPLYLSEIDGADRLATNIACVEYMRETYGIWPAAAA